ncbi:ABC transporter permease [Brachymonas sp. M4Q-1]|uniref:ABC transporter permease n=1 Tax=Brachymonas sp. M4Q-1 TaxID=3416906 RepID=UPI003CEEDC10
MSDDDRTAIRLQAARASVRRSLQNIYFLGIKEFFSLLRDWAMMGVIVFMFTGAVLADARAKPDTLSNAAIAVVDEDQSALSQRLIDALRPPYFMPPRLIGREQMDRVMDMGEDTFVLDIPPNFQRDLVAGRHPALQLNVDATRQSQALSGPGYVETILVEEVLAWAQNHRSADLPLPTDLVVRVKYNPNLYGSWFGGLTSIINNLTLLSIVLAGAALIREREHGTIEHLLVMPVTSLEIMLSKVWSMSVVVLGGALLALTVIVRGVLGVQVNGSVALFALGTLIYLFSTTSLGIFLGTLARSMPQFGLLAILVLLPLIVLSGSITPLESMPEAVRLLMSATPTIHFVSFAQGVLFRGAGIETIWPSLLAICVTGSVFFWIANVRLRKTIGEME